MAGGFLASDDERFRPTRQENTGVDTSIADTLESVSAVGATGSADDDTGGRREYSRPFDTEDRDVERAIQTRDTGADHDIDPRYTSLVDGDRAPKPEGVELTGLDPGTRVVDDAGASGRDSDSGPTNAGWRSAQRWRDDATESH